MEQNEYEKAWDEGETPAAPATNALKAAKSTAEVERDRQAKEFSDAFFADDIESSNGDTKKIDGFDKAEVNGAESMDETK